MRSIGAVLLLGCGTISGLRAGGPPLTPAQRVAAQTAIERVYQAHRIWPAANPAPKPAFETAVPAAVLERKALAPTRMSAALQRYWGVEISPAMLQREMERMASRSRDPRMLRELFAALGEDPALIAETLARGRLAERLLRARYARDPALHAEARAIAERLARGEAPPDRGVAGISRGRLTYRLAAPDDASAPGPAAAHDAELFLAADEFDEITATWDARRRQTAAGAAGFFLEETPDAFQLERLVTQSGARIAIETITVEKRPFESWWSEVEPGLPVESVQDALANPDYELPNPRMAAAAGCDLWDPVKLRSVPDARRFHSTVWTGAEMIIWGGIASTAMNSGGRYDPATDEWTPTSTGANVPGVNYTHTAVWTGTEMVVWGAFNNTGGRYNPATDSWRPTSTGANTPAGRDSYTAVWTGTRMIIWGGNIFSLGPQNNGGRYDPVNDTWLPVSTGANVPAARYSHTAVWTGSVMVVWGGSDGIGPSLNSGGRYDPVNDTWLPTSIGTNVPPPRFNHAAIWTGSRMIVWGGDSGGSGYLNSGGRYDPVGDTWLPTSTGTNVPGVRTSPKAVWTGSEMIVWGGNFGGYLNTGGRYNPSTDSWLATSTGANVPAGRTLHSQVWTGTEMIVWGGNNGTNLNSGARYTPGTNSWIQTNASALSPAARYGHTAVWTGAEMIVWGGTGSGNLNSGGQYDPATDSWTPTSTAAGVPAARTQHTAVWTGSRMIVWGGSGYLNTGGRYDPVGNAWLSTSTAGAGLPAGRILHTAVWSGTEMIVWGGATGSGIYADSGGRYAPGLDQWTATPVVAGTPSARQSHSAVWTGSEMIVWGGYGGAGLQNTGGRYDPPGGGWTAVAIDASTPAPRHQHTAVWTGSEMIVWGGATGATTYTNTGGRYDPVGGGWLATSIGTGVPVARYLHRVVWTGDEMIVWGGQSTSTTYQQTGGRYRPASNGWTATTTVSAPSARSEHTAVWTTGGMIVWGGRNGSGNFDSGAIYAGTYPAASPGDSLRLARTTTVDLAWNASAGAISYNVKRCSGTCAPATVVATPAAAAYSEANNATTYFYAVEAVNACGATP